MHDHIVSNSGSDSATASGQSAVDPALAQSLIDVCRGKRLAALTGAGISTDAGLPDYRGTGSSGDPTVDIDLFLSDPMWQRWVWERNQVTWKAVEALPPSAGHRALARLEQAGLLSGVATQNVDGLDQKAGLKTVAELHGSFMWVDCLQCGTRLPRTWLDQELRKLNLALADDPNPAHAAILARVDEKGARASKIKVVPCPKCGGVLKPNVVFFGEQLPQDAMSLGMKLAAECQVLLVVGTSCKVSTAMWVAIEGIRAGAEVVIINRGPCDLDGSGAVKLRIEGGASEYLTALADALVAN